MENDFISRRAVEILAATLSKKYLAEGDLPASIGAIFVGLHASNIPPADVAKIVHARWERLPYGRTHCTNCHYITHGTMAYCECCGAKMDEVLKEEATQNV